MKTTPTSSSCAARRVVLVDLDWHEADLVLELLARLEIEPGLVVGRSADDPGVRIAELLEIRRTTDLTDLARELFDAAFVGAESPRRPRLQRLLEALEIPLLDLHRLGGLAVAGEGSSAPEPEPGRDWDALLGMAIPDLMEPERGAAVLEPSTSDVTADVEPEAAILEPSTIDRAAPECLEPEPAMAPAAAASGSWEWPGPDDGEGLERALVAWIGGVDATSAELRAGSFESVRPILRLGEDDPWLAALADQALRLEVPQVARRFRANRAWGAWPFRSPRHRGVLAVGGIGAPEGLRRCEQATRELAAAWRRHDRGLEGADPTDDRAWIPVPEFLDHLDRAMDGVRRAKETWDLHRCEAPGEPAAAQAWWGRMPHRLRGEDVLCRAGSRAFLLHRAPARGTASIERRLLELWHETWSEAGVSSPPPLESRSVRLDTPADATWVLSITEELYECVSPRA